MNLEKDIENVVKRAEDNARKIEENANRIYQNTGALEILKTFKADSQRFFAMWLITFVCLLCSLCVIMFLLHR